MYKKINKKKYDKDRGLIKNRDFSYLIKVAEFFLK